ncbi:Putative oxidoreductase, Fe-S subunit [Rhodovulum sp. PH10]|uniref:2-oxoacid:acceptor oxidoreductase family protein n=1 Tax=Rhodovulum sp. PH10 TaxID=1187851 RepID=UPI00027C1F56|nr:2-oxoacid:acceptor oxidoreductase family protein [Rhodovulum sp. PH10]EJW09392.1 Putative oxidoreductase, Fe-S subunit [Rhodovulum sp. PH10]
MNAKYPGNPTVINGNGAVAQVMGHVCGGVIGYPITPSTEISELYEAFRSAGGCNVWGKHPFFFEPEGEHSAQSGALGAALTGAKFVSNASSSQGILYGLESHYVTVGKKVGGFVLQVAARVVSKHSLNVMAGHDDVYALLQSGYTILFGSNPQEAADLAAISYKVSATSLIPVANAMDGFATSHMMSEALMPEPELLREFLGDPAGRIKAPTVAQELLFGAKGRVFQLETYLAKHAADFAEADLAALKAHLQANADAIEKDGEGALIAATLGFVPEELQGQWRRQWVNAFEKGTRQLVPALVDVNNPGLTGGVQNQPDFQAGSVDHRTHFVAAVPGFVREAMAEYSALTGREYKPVMTYMCDDAEYVMVGLGSVTDDAEAVAAHLRRQGKKVGVVSIKLLQPFPEAELVAALAGKKAVTVLERSDVTALTSFVTQALFKGVENAAGERHPGIPAIKTLPKITTAIFGLGAHDLQPRHLVAAFENMETKNAPFVYLGSQFFAKNPSPRLAALQDKLKAAYPETELMALETAENPNLLPPEAFRIRFHSVGGYGTIATGKLLTDILAGALDMHSKASPKYGSEKSGAPTNYYITLSPETVKITNAELEDVEIVASPDHKVFSHTNPLRGLVAGGTFVLQSDLPPLEVWRQLPKRARQTIRDKKIKVLVVDGFKVAKAHAPTPELETRMMGIAFIGAICGHVDRIVADASRDVMLNKIRSQIAKKFGSKGAAVVEGNMAVIKEGAEATQVLDYTKPEFAEADSDVVKKIERSVAISAEMCRAAGVAPSAGFFDKDYYEEMIAAPFREGTVGEAPVLPGTGMFMPAGSAAWKDKGLFRREVPEFDPSLCTGCMECTLVCPDAAIPNTVIDIHELLQTGIKHLEVAEAQREALRAKVWPLSEAVREAYRSTKEFKPFSEVVAAAAATLDTDNATLKRNLGKLAEVLAVLPVAKTRPFFDAMEKEKPGTGGLYSVAVDPWKCSGCLECIDVCGPGALKSQHQDVALLDTLQERFEFLGSTPNTPARFTDGALAADGDTKRLMLDRANYYATTGGHGACRGCGEVTAIRLVTSTNHAIQAKRRKEHIREVEGLILKLDAKLAGIQDDAARRERIQKARQILDKRLYMLESGPTGNGPASAVIANATGCSSVYASTFPFNPYNDPWVNSLFQDTPAVAKGLFEGLTAAATDDVKALRIAKLELDDAYDPAVHDKYFKTFGWPNFTPDELALLPTVISMGGDGATYDIGFGALSRLLATRTPIKVVVLNTGVYSNTGGQASTASLTGQDSDLSRFGTAHHGKQEDRKELGLIAAFHPNVFVVQTSTALQGHFLKNVMAYLAHTSSPAVLDVYTPCQAEHGIADAAASRRARLAVESRMNPVFVHDPKSSASLRGWFDLDGNPDLDKDWTTTTIEYVEDGAVKLMDVPLTPAYFAQEETRFKKQYRKLKDEANALPIHEYIDLPADQRAAKVPFVWSTDDQKRLVKLEVSNAIVHLVEERRKYWRTLQYLAGRSVEKLDASHKVELAALQQRYQQAVDTQESTLDTIARAMSELAASSNAPANGALAAALSPFGGGLGSGAAAAPAAAAPAAASANGNAAGVPTLHEEDIEKCTNCKTCYQSAAELFEKTKIVVNGVPKEVAHAIPGALETVQMTPDLKSRLARVAANCDAEIIR